MKFKSLLSLLSAPILLASCGVDPVSSETTLSSFDSSLSEEEIPSGDGYVDSLPEKIDDGLILHAFNWTFDQIRENLDAIADAGYRAVQTSPVQQPKSGGARWEFFYQPVSFSIATSSPLGGVEELTALCQASEEKGISIISDIVFNHMATDGNEDADGLPVVDAEVESYEPEIYANQAQTFHHNKNGTVTQYYNGLPDLNTANPLVQERALSLLKECIDCGVDGFRFDAAKHIETPYDARYASDFWTNTLGAAQTYYREKTGGELYAYGEILNDVDDNRPVENYTKLGMKVTDNSYIGNGVSNGVLGSAKDAQLIVNAAYGKQTSPTNLLTWVESHDTFASETNHSSNKKIARLWAILAARKDTNSLFFARPDNNLTVAQIGTYDFEDEVFGTVNRFHNRFVGAEEEQHAVDTNFYVNERYSETDQGAVVIDLKLSGSHEISFHHLPDGYYFDQITGNPVKISGGKGTISFEERGVAVLTKTRNLVRPSLSISHRGGLFSSPFDVTLQLHQASASSYSLDGGEEISFADSVKIRIGEGVESGNSTILTVHYTNGQYSARRTFVYRKVTLIEGYFNILNLKESYLTDYALYVWSWGAGGSSYHQDYTWNAEHKILLMNDVSNYTGFLLVIFEKGHTISNPHVWESCLKQTADINPKASFFDASTF